MKLDEIRARQEQTRKEHEEARLLAAEQTARLRALRLAREAAEKKEASGSGDENMAPDGEWLWHLPQAHRR